MLVVGDICGELLRLRAGDGLERRLVLLEIPDFLVVERLPRRADAQDDAVEDRLPDQALVLDHAAVGEKFLEIDAHTPGVAGIGRAEVDQENADALRLDGWRCTGIFERYNHAHPCGFALFRHPCQGKEGFATVAALPRVGGTMTIAEYCILGAVLLYLLTIAPF